MASARRISGSASPSRLVACSNCGQVVEVIWRRWGVRAEASLVDGERAAHQRLGLGQPVRGLQQLARLLRSAGDVGMFVAEACLVDGEGAAHQRLGLGKPVGGLQQPGEVAELSATSRVSGTEASLRDCQRAAHQRLCLGQPIGGLQQVGQVVELDRDLRVFGTTVFLEIVSVRLISGSASARRLVARNR